MSEAVPVTDKLQCYFCGALGAIRFDDIEDGLFGIEGRWQIRECARCDLWWLDPMPRPEALTVLYESYFTHEDEAEPRVQRFVRGVVSTSRYGGGKSLPGAILSRVGPLRELVDVEHMTLGPGPGRVLDVGCGNGRFLLRARTWGGSPSVSNPTSAARP
jgi:hypothetical protein